jgi:hypothetical protein
MSLLKRGTPEERRAEQEKKALARQQEDARKAAEKAEQERERREQAWLESPAGQARTAWERGDHIFQFEMEVKNTKAVVVPMMTATTTTTTKDPVVILNAVAKQGWELVSGSMVFHELGSESRDKFLASGQNIAVKGTVIGYYLFRRTADREAVDGPTF